MIRLHLKIVAFASFCICLFAAAPTPAASPDGSKAIPTRQSAPSGNSDTRIRDKWALIVGISSFKNPAYNLKYAAKDAIDFRNYLINDAHFAPDHVKMLINQQATEKAIKSAFGDKFLPRVCMPGDLVVIYISTHGTPAARDQAGEYYLIAWDSDAEDLYATGVNMRDLADRIKKAVNTDRALIVMDTCFSGGIGVKGKDLARVSNVDTTQLPVGKGHRIISSSSHDERSYESKRYQNGVFTHYLIEGLKQGGGNIDIQKAFDYMKSKVQWEVQSDMGVTQTPKIAGDWNGSELVLSALPSEKREVLPELVTKPSEPAAAQPVQVAPQPSAASTPAQIAYAPVSTPPVVPVTPVQPPVVQQPAPQTMPNYTQPVNYLVDSRLVGTWQGTLVTYQDHWTIVLQILPDGSYQSSSMGTTGAVVNDRGSARMLGGKWVCQSFDGHMEGGTYVVTHNDEFVLVGAQGPIVYKRKN